MNGDPNNPQRNSELRGSLLNHARLKADRDPDGWVSGLMLMIAARDESRRDMREESHATQLLTDLVELGLLDEKAAQEKGIGHATLQHRKFRLNAKGRDLCWGRIDPIPGVNV